MKKLTKTQWITFGITVLGMLLGFVIDNAGLFGIGSKLTAIIGFIKIVYDLYVSYSEIDVVSFGEYMVSKDRTMKVSETNLHNVTHDDLENWKDAN